MPQLRATVETFCCNHSSRSLFSTKATSARGCLPLENCSTPAMATAKRGPAMSDNSSSRSRIVPPWTSPAKHRVTCRFSSGTQCASGTPDCRGLSSAEMSSGTGRAMNRRGIVVEILGHEGQQVLYHDFDTVGIGMNAIALVEGRVLRHAVEDEGIERDLIFVGQLLVEPVEGRDIFRPEVARRHHADQPDRHLGLLELGDDRVEVALGRR